MLQAAVCLPGAIELLPLSTKCHTPTENVSHIIHLCVMIFGALSTQHAQQPINALARADFRQGRAWQSGMISWNPSAEIWRILHYEYYTLKSDIAIVRRLLSVNNCMA